MNCAELDILLCDYVDGALDAARKAAVEEHLSHCASCAELAGDASAAVQFMDRCAEVEPPKELLTRLVFAAAPAAKESRGIRVRFARFLEPVLQPRFAMGMAMTILSFSLLGRFVPIRQLQPKDLNPVEIWASLDDKVHRTWERGLKYYESMRLFVELKSRFQELTNQDDEQRKAQPADGAGSVSPAKPGEQTKR